MNPIKRMRKERESNFCVLAVSGKNKGQMQKVSALEDKQRHSTESFTVWLVV